MFIPYVAIVVYSLHIIRYSVDVIGNRVKLLEYFKRFAHILIIQPLGINTIYICYHCDIDLFSKSISGGYSCLLPHSMDNAIFNRFVRILFCSLMEQEFLVRLYAI